ncbi:MAG: sigma-54 factor interaction domain-containing protein [Candidatus Competibacteraceae bacterium]|nr:sigma-54 factor interaction domain-containing protein [Candidatus Competibacteraceae bacterium]
MAIRAWVSFVGSDQQGLGKDIIAFLAQHGVDVQTCDPYMAQGYGVVLFREFNQDICPLLREVSRRCQERVVVGCCQTLATGHAWQLIQAGAADVLSCLECQQSVCEIMARLSRWETVDGLMTSPRVENALVGASPAWRAILRQVVEVAYCTDAAVLILGESGTGKELVARLIHDLGPHSSKKDPVILDCSTITPELSGSEFFGHERGAFTGAISARDGAFALADGGTLFLDEIGELPLHLQTQLLRVIQEHTYKG